MNAKTNQPDKATPRPWAFRHIKSGCHVVVVGSIESFENGQFDINPVCDMAIPEPTLECDIELAKANAALIVKAVNEHAALEAVVEQFKWTHEMLKRARKELPLDALVGFSDRMLIDDGVLARLAALRGQKVEGGK